MSQNEMRISSCMEKLSKSRPSQEVIDRWNERLLRLKLNLANNAQETMDDIRKWRAETIRLLGRHDAFGDSDK